MSYDLAVFDPAAAPTDRGEFEDWYDRVTEWGDPRGHDDPVICSPPLKSWYLEMIEEFPAMNGPYGRIHELPDDPSVSDYCVTEHLIYVAFAWSKGREAYEACLRLAAKHRVGFFDVSDDGSVWLPDGMAASLWLTRERMPELRRTSEAVTPSRRVRLPYSQRFVRREKPLRRPGSRRPASFSHESD